MNFAFLFLIISLIFLGAVGYYFTVARKAINDEKDKVVEEEKAHRELMEKDEERIKEELAEVHEKATLILSESEKIAQELINELENVLGKKESNVSVNLPEGSDFEIELGSLSDRLKNNYVNKIKHLLVSLEKFEIQKAHEVEKFAEEQQVSTDVNLQKKRIDELNKMHERIEKYKKEELLLFDQKVKEVVDQAAIEVLGHSLTNQEHGELIAKALEKAREEHKI